jgi:16S rRNA U1498 N3-methylase RsmE
MHGSPMSKWDNRELWKKNDYRDYAIIAEPYFDLDFNTIFYITDASRSWNNEEVTLRDKVDTKFHFEINNTEQIIKLLKDNKLPNQLMISTHPHNWADGTPEWLKIMLWQGFKNQIKKILVRKSI